MSHNTVFGGVSREIEGGTPLIGGVAREIESGLVLVGGVQRDISFGGGVCVVTMSGTGSSMACVTINGVTYTGAAVVEVPHGTVMHITALGGAFADGVNITAAAQYTIQSNITVNFQSVRVVITTV